MGFRLRTLVGRTEGKNEGEKGGEGEGLGSELETPNIEGERVGKRVREYCG
jgi:hypothetical protein